MDNRPALPTNSPIMLPYGYGLPNAAYEDSKDKATPIDKPDLYEYWQNLVFHTASSAALLSAAWIFKDSGYPESHLFIYGSMVVTSLVLGCLIIAMCVKQSGIQIKGRIRMRVICAFIGLMLAFVLHLVIW